MVCHFGGRYRVGECLQTFVEEFLGVSRDNWGVIVEFRPVCLGDASYAEDVESEVVQQYKDIAQCGLPSLVRGQVIFHKTVVDFFVISLTLLDPDFDVGVCASRDQLRNDLGRGKGSLENVIEKLMELIDDEFAFLVESVKPPTSISTIHTS